MNVINSTVKVVSFVILTHLSASICCAQSASPSPVPTPTVAQSQEKIEVFTEEVVIPVTVYDHSGHLVLAPPDIIVFEDDVRQTVRSVRRLPANVLLLLDTGGELNPAMRVSTTRDIAVRLVSTLQSGDRIAGIQFGNRLEVFQGWTNNVDDVVRALRTKLISGKRPQLTRALFEATAQLKQVPAGTRHLVLITDGVDWAGDQSALNEAIRHLLNSNITVHVIGYTSLGRKKLRQQNPLIKITNKKRKSAQDIADEIMNPTQIPEYKKRNKIYLIIDTDFPMRRKRENYAKATTESEIWLTALAEETGGLMFLPKSEQEMISRAEEIAKEIDRQYVVTYSPKRPLAEATVEEEYRRIKIAAAVVGIQLRSRRGYVARAP